MTSGQATARIKNIEEWHKFKENAEKNGIKIGEALEQILVAYNQPMPENIGLVAPTRTGYEFTGYSRSGTYYYDANLKSVRNFELGYLQ